MRSNRSSGRELAIDVGGGSRLLQEEHRKRFELFFPWCIMRRFHGLGAGKLTVTGKATRKEQISLARERPFRLGNVRVNPATRMIRFAGKKAVIEPRVMQVLVALSQTQGEVVSRTDLIDTCWGGRIVTDDAITRALSQLRRAGEDLGCPFKIETIRGVGTRLVMPEDALEHDEAAPAHGRRPLLIGLASIFALASAGGALLLGRSSAASQAAREYYRLGIQARGQDSIERMERGAALFAEATRTDPKFADAWGALAESYRSLLEYGPRPDAQRLASLSRSSALRALALDPNNVEAQVAILLLPPWRGRWMEMQRELARLLARHPENSIVQFDLAFGFAEVGRWTESLPHFRSVATREKFWALPPLFLFMALHSSGMDEEAEQLLKELLQRFPGRLNLWQLRIRQLIHQRRIGEAVDFAVDQASRPTEVLDPRIDLEVRTVRALAEATGSASADAATHILTTLRETPSLSSTGMHCLSALGELDSAFSIADGIYFGSGPWRHAHWERAHTFHLFLPSTAPLRGDPRFQDLAVRLGLERYWSRAGVDADFRVHRT